MTRRHDAEGFTTVQSREPKTGSWGRFMKRGAMLWAFAGGTVLLIAVPFLVWLDNRTRGPYVTWYNQRLQRLADEAHLVGRPESDVVPTLGPPSFVWDDEGGARRTYNYAPAGVPFSKFQVHCRDHVVASLEQFDD